MGITGPDSIQDLHQVLTGTRRTEGAGGHPRGQVGDSKTATSDTVALSSESLERGAIIEQIKALPDVPTKDLSAIRAAIESGTYRVDSDRVAAGVIQDTVLNSLV